MKCSRYTQINIAFFCCAYLLAADMVLGLPPNYEDIDESEDQPQDAKGINYVYYVLLLYKNIFSYSMSFIIVISFHFSILSDFNNTHVFFP